MAAGTVSSRAMLGTAERLMAVARGAQWSQAATYRGRALSVSGSIAEGFAMFEEAWHRADRLDDPVAAALATRMAAGTLLMLYDNAQAEKWCRRELGRRRSRLVGELQFVLTHLLASARVAQGDLKEARQLLSDYEGAAAQHPLLNCHEGDWDRAIMLLRKDFEYSRAEGRIAAMTDSGSVLGRIVRVANHRVEAEALLDETLQAALGYHDLNRELFIRLELALIAIDLGQFPRAKEELRRCKEILDSGEDWRGHRGTYLYTCALLKVAEHAIKFATPDGRWHVAFNGKMGAMPEEASDGFRAAIEVFQRYHAPWEEASVLLYWAQAQMVLSQVRLAAEKYQAAFAIFDRIATPRWNDQSQTAMFRFMVLDTLVQPITVGDGTGANVFRKEGDYWTVSFHGSMLRLRDTIGMRYLGHLLANPGVEFAAEELVETVQRANPKRSTRNARAATSNGRANGDHRNLDEMTRERARLMVTKRIKDVIARIRHNHPELARHLATRIRTGYACRYNPGDDHPDAWLT
jgi:tetratricopeptide (TPR) repeat protein